MSRHLWRRVGQLIMAGFDGLTIPDDLRTLAREFDLGGVILFGRNVEAPEQVAELAHDARALSRDVPVWVSVDQEGGRVARLGAAFTTWPPMRALGESGDAGLARRFGHALARELKAVGISLDYAPVLDVHTNARNPVIGDRALSAHADEVARLGAAIIEGLQDEGVAACGKHFPGHGDTSGDSHHELPVVEHPTERLYEVELVPFKSAIAKDVAMIMTAHVLYPMLDDARPATLSSHIVTSMLRRDMGFSGVIATDDMSMQAIAADWPVEQATVAALDAGCDLVLLCAADIEQQVQTLEAVIQSVETDPRSMKRVEEALRRHEEVKARFLGRLGEDRPLSPRELRGVLSCDEHAAVADEIGRYV